MFKEDCAIDGIKIVKGAGFNQGINMNELKKIPTIRITDFDIELGNKLRTLREEHKLSQKGMGNIIGVTHQQVMKYERAQNRISAQRLAVVCQVFELKPEFFFEGYL